jgi:hypothetical protein
MDVQTKRYLKALCITLRKRNFGDTKTLLKSKIFQIEKEVKCMKNSEVPIRIDIIFYIIFAMQFLIHSSITVGVGIASYRSGIMAEKVSVLETQNPLPQELN